MASDGLLHTHTHTHTHTYAHRFTNVKYNYDLNTLDDLYVHLTNVAVQVSKYVDAWMYVCVYVDVCVCMWMSVSLLTTKTELFLHLYPPSTIHLFVLIFLTTPTLLLLLHYIHVNHYSIFTTHYHPLPTTTPETRRRVQRQARQQVDG
jgi:hypothetical protein